MRQIVGRLVHPDELWCEVKEEGSFELTAPLFVRIAFDDIGDVDRNEVDDLSRRVLSKSREERLDVGFVPLRSDDHDLVNAVIVPTGEEFIDGTMEGLPTQGAGTWVRRPIRLRKAVMESRSYRQLQATGKIEGANGKDKPHITGEKAADFGPGKVVQPQ